MIKKTKKFPIVKIPISQLKNYWKLGDLEQIFICLREESKKQGLSYDSKYDIRTWFEKEMYFQQNYIKDPIIEKEKV